MIPPWYVKVVYISLSIYYLTRLQSPVSIILTLTVPVVDNDEDLNNWNKWLNVLHCVTSPLIITFISNCTYSPVHPLLGHPTRQCRVACGVSMGNEMLPQCAPISGSLSLFLSLSLSLPLSLSFRS